MIENETLWKQVLGIVRVSVSGAVFSTWFRNTHITNIKNGSGKQQTVEVGCPSLYIQDQLERRYFGTIQDALNQLTGKTNEVIFVIKPVTTDQKTQKSSPLFEYNEIENEFEIALSKSKLPSGFSFENFAVSGSNQLAWAAAYAVAKKPGNAYNPLFIWGGVGVGKTHLTIATAREILKNFLDKKIIYCTTDEFMVEIIDAIRTKTSQEFRKKFRKVDVLLVDDIEFLSGKPSTQEEFFNTFNSIVQNVGQVIVTSDHPPNEIPKLATRLRDRFEAGLVVDIGEPDFELLCAIATIKARERAINLPPETIGEIANRFTSPRAIEGFLVKLQYQATLEGKITGGELAEKLLNKQGNGKLGSFTNRVSCQEVLNAVSSYFSVTKKSLIFKGRAKSIVIPRQILMYLLRVELKLNLVEIGKVLGGRDHTTIIHGVGRIFTLSKQDKEINQHLMRIKQEVWG